VSRDQRTTLATDTNNATFVLEVDTSSLALGDLLEIRVYTVTLSGGSTHLPATLHQRAGVRRGPLMGELAPGGDAWVVNNLPDTAIISDDPDGHSYTLRD
jgi:hypothetical protein